MLFGISVQRERGGSPCECNAQVLLRVMSMPEEVLMIDFPPRRLLLSVALEVVAHESSPSYYKI